MAEASFTSTVTESLHLVAGRTQEIADGVFVIPDRRAPLVPNIGVIVGQRAALVVDTGLGPASGHVVHSIARELAGDRQLFLTITHFHPEHGYGAQAFQDATIIYNREQHDEFRQKADGYLHMFRGLSEAIAHQLDGVEFVSPHILYDGAADLDLGGKLVQLRGMGRAHTRGDQIVVLPAEGILFAGDLVENCFFPIFPFFPPHDVDVDGNAWIAALETMQRMEPSIVVPGHGEIGDVGLIAITREYLRQLESESRRLASEGHDADAIIALLDPQLRAQYPEWDAPEWITFGIRSFLFQAE